MLNYIVTEKSITILIANRPEIIDCTHPNFQVVEDALKAGKSEKQILDLINIAKAVTNFAEATETTKGKVVVKDGEIFYMNKKVHSSLAIRIMTLMKKGFDITPFINFMENLYLNPSYRAVNETYDFLEACNLPITEDGCFLAYKKVTDDYLDCYTRTIDNSIGAIPEMLRCQVNDDKNQTCSNGLHVCSWNYLDAYSGDRTVLVKVSPENVVSVPVDYNNAKMRVCKYEVVGEIDNCDPDKKLNNHIISNDSLKAFNLNESSVKDDGTYSENCESEDYREETLPTGNIYSDKYTDDESDHEIETYEDYEVVSSIPTYNNCDEILVDIDLLDLSELKELYKDIREASEFLNSITNSTSFWKNKLIDIVLVHYDFDCLNETPDTNDVFYSESKRKFNKALKTYLKTFEKEKWSKLIDVLIDLGQISSVRLVMGSFNLKDYETVVNKIKTLVKEGKFKKKTLLKELGI